MIYLLLFSGSITVTKVIQGNSAIEGNVDNNEITVSEFTITESNTATKIKIKKGEEEENVDISTKTSIKDIITAIKV